MSKPDKDYDYWAYVIMGLVVGIVLTGLYCEISS